MKNLSSIAVGALGGSGTRVLAQILQDSNVFIGKTLNNSLDNILFTTLFKNPKWFKKSTSNQRQKRLLIFQKSMSGISLNFGEKIELGKAIASHPFVWRRHPIGLLLRELHNQGSKTTTIRWGWKEPNTHIFLQDISDHFPDIKYIHLIRHGLDMAFSDNIQQLEYWGYKFDLIIKNPENKVERAQKQLKYWILANQEAVAEGKKLFGNNFKLVNYTKLCEETGSELESLFEFLEISMNKEQIQKLSNIPKLPTTHNRYKEQDLSIFSEEDLRTVQEMGFKID